MRSRIPTTGQVSARDAIADYSRVQVLPSPDPVREQRRVEILPAPEPVPEAPRSLEAVRRRNLVDNWLFAGLVTLSGIFAIAFATFVLSPAMKTLVN